MTMPGGSGGLDTGFNPWGIQNQASQLATRDQATVTAHYQAQVQSDPAIIDMIEGFWNGIMAGFQGLGDFLQQLIQSITGAAEGTFETLSGFVSQIVSGLGNALQMIRSAIDAFVQMLTGSAFTGNDLSALLWALNPLNWIQQGISAIGGAWEQLAGQIAGLQAQVTAINNNPSTPASQTGIDLALWTNVAGTLALDPTGTHLESSALAAAYRGTPSNVREPATDKHFASIEIDGKMQGTARAWICGNTTMSNYAAVEIYCGFDGDAVRILTGASPTLAVIQEQTDFLDAKLQNKWVFEIRYDPVTNKFFVLRNTKPIGLEWEDATNIVTHGSGKRKVGVVINAEDDPDQKGPGIGKFTYGDWTE